MNDCDADPAIQHWAERFTASPKRFELNLQRSLPRLRYIQATAAEHQVAGEFVLLPWVESRFRPVHGKGRQPGGMWQIVPATARTLGLHVGREFDGRMDVATSTEAVMAMLQRYYQEFGDWRLVDYAFNAGEFATRKLIARHGTPPAEPAIPVLPVRNVTREHLIKLLAIACVIREPDRFHVTLPVLAKDEHLVAVPIDHPMSVAKAAEHAGMSEDALRRYNAGFLGNRIDPAHASSLMIPDGHVDQFVDAMRQATGAEDDNRATRTDRETPPPKRHTVRKGETLWQIARRYGVSVKELKRWNHLKGDKVRPGQILRIEG